MYIVIIRLRSLTEAVFKKAYGKYKKKTLINWYSVRDLCKFFTIGKDQIKLINKFTFVNTFCNAFSSLSKMLIKKYAAREIDVPHLSFIIRHLKFIFNYGRFERKIK